MALAWGSCGLILSSGLLAILFLKARAKRSGKKETRSSFLGGLLRRSKHLVGMGTYVWGIVSLGLFYADLYTDITVLREVWGQWPKRVLLPSFVASVLVTSLFAAHAWVIGSGALNCYGGTDFSGLGPPTWQEIGVGLLLVMWTGKSPALALPGRECLPYGPWRCCIFL